MPRSVLVGVLLCMVLGGSVRWWGLAQRGVWEVDEATYTLGARAYVHLHRARAEAQRTGIDVRDRAEMRGIIAQVFPMEYDFRYHFTRGPARSDVLMSGFRTWGKPTYCAAVTVATWLFGPRSLLGPLTVSALAGTLLVGVIGWGAWRLTSGTWAAVGAAAWAATSLTLVQYSRTVYGAMLWTLCFGVFLAVAIPVWRRVPGAVRVRDTAVRGLLVGLLITVFYGMLPLAALAGCVEAWWLWRVRRTGGPVVKHAVVWLAAGLLPALLWQVAGLWRVHYLHDTLGFENVHTYVGEVFDQLRTEVEISRRSLPSTVRFWGGSVLALEGLVASLLASAGGVFLAKRARCADGAAGALLWFAGMWLIACTVSRFQLGRIYTPMLPIFGLCVGVAIHAAARKARGLGPGLLVLVVGYGLWNLQPLLAVRSGLPAAAGWIAANGHPGRVAVCTFGYNQLLRVHLDRVVANPPTRAVLERQADVYVDVGPTATHFTETTARVRPLAVFPDPVLHYRPGRVDLGERLDPFWRFRLTEADWRRLRGRDPDPVVTELIRVYAVSDML